MSSGSNQAITYEEVAAYQADQGISTYALPSGGTATGGFVVNWDLENGFSDSGWDMSDPHSPAYGWNVDQIRYEVTNSGNLNGMFKQWSEKVQFTDRLNWVTDWMNTHDGCVTES